MNNVVHRSSFREIDFSQSIELIPSCIEALLVARSGLKVYENNSYRWNAHQWLLIIQLRNQDLERQTDLFSFPLRQLLSSINMADKNETIKSPIFLFSALQHSLYFCTSICIVCNLKSCCTLVSAICTVFAIQLYPMLLAVSSVLPCVFIYSFSLKLLFSPFYTCQTICILFLIRNVHNIVLQRVSKINFNGTLKASVDQRGVFIKTFVFFPQCCTVTLKALYLYPCIHTEVNSTMQQYKFTDISPFKDQNIE